MITVSPFLLLLIAATQMWVNVCCSKGSSMEDISGFALALHCPEREYSVIQSFILLIGIAAKEPYHRLVQDLILLQLQCLLDLALMHHGLICHFGMMLTIAGVSNSFQVLCLFVICWIKQRSSKCYFCWFTVYSDRKKPFLPPTAIRDLDMSYTCSDAWSCS